MLQKLAVSLVFLCALTAKQARSDSKCDDGRADLKVFTVYLESNATLRTWLPYFEPELGIYRSALEDCQDFDIDALTAFRQRLVNNLDYVRVDAKTFASFHKVLVSIDAIQAAKVLNFEEALQTMEQAEIFQHSTDQTAERLNKTLQSLEKLENSLRARPDYLLLAANANLAALKKELQPPHSNPTYLEQILDSLSTPNAATETSVWRILLHDVRASISALNSSDQASFKHKARAYQERFVYLAKKLKQTGELDDKETIALRDSYRWLYAHEQQRAALSSIKQALQRKNLHISVANSFIANASRQTLSQSIPINQVEKDGTHIQGTSQVTGEIYAHAVDQTTSGQAKLQVKFVNGLAATNVTARQSLGTAGVHSTSNIDIGIPVLLDETGVSIQQPLVHVQTQAQPQWLNINGGPIMKWLFSGFGWRQLMSQRGTIAQQTSDRIVKEVKDTLLPKIEQKLTELRRTYETAFNISLNRNSIAPAKAHYTSTDGGLLASFNFDAPGELQALSPASNQAFNNAAAITIALHDSALNNILNALRGRVVDSQTIKDLLGVPSDGQSGRSELSVPSRANFSREMNALTVAFGDQRISLDMKLAALRNKQGEEFPAAGCRVQLQLTPVNIILINTPITVLTTSQSRVSTRCQDQLAEASAQEFAMEAFGGGIYLAPTNGLTPKITSLAKGWLTLGLFSSATPTHSP